MICLAQLLERDGQVTEAEAIYQAALKKDVEQKFSVAAFYKRNADKNPEYAAKAAEIVKTLFPKGMEKFQLSDLKAPPDKGVLIYIPSKLAASVGLLKDYVIVGINDYRVYNIDQYQFMLNLLLNSKVKTTLWTGKDYQELVVSTASQNDLDIAFFDYPQP